jgi:hypothetical protein
VRLLRSDDNARRPPAREEALLRRHRESRSNTAARTRDVVQWMSGDLPERGRSIPSGIALLRESGIGGIVLRNHGG